MERQERDGLLICDRGDQRVQPADRRFRRGPAVVPRENVRKRDADPELLPATHHLSELVGGDLHGDALGDVVDPALYDEDVGALRTAVETSSDLVGSLAVDAAVTKIERRVGPRGPVLPLALLVAPESRVVAGAAFRDRVAERGDHDSRPFSCGDPFPPRCAPGLPWSC